MNVSYPRQTIPKMMGKKDKDRLRKSTVTIVGLGALGSVSSEILCRTGVGRLVLIDRDIVEPSNLQRQTLFNQKDIGLSKAVQASVHLNKINPELTFDPLPVDLTYKNIKESVKGDLLLDCTDNLETRYLINEFCIENKLRWVHGAAVGATGVVKVFLPGEPCFRCLYSDSRSAETCGTAGILTTTAFVTGTVQALEALKILLGKEPVLDMIRIDCWNTDIMKIKLKQRRNCIACIQKNFEYLNGKEQKMAVKMCGTELYQITGPSVDLNLIERNLSKSGNNVTNLGYAIKSERFTVFSDGRTLIRAKDGRVARSIYSRFIGC